MLYTAKIKGSIPLTPPHPFKRLPHLTCSCPVAVQRRVIQEPLPILAILEDDKTCTGNKAVSQQQKADPWQTVYDGRGADHLRVPATAGVV